MSLVLEIHHTLGQFVLDVQLTLGSGLTALVGPSGAGKTTVLNIVAGTVRPERGVVRLDATILADSRSETWLSPHRRQIGYVFQEPRLFPHLTVRQNLLFGRWFRRERAQSTRLTEDEITTLLNLRPLLHRYPSKLSGGERQRVALGRALLASPKLLLLDEPLAAVDQPHRGEILPYLDRLRDDHAIPTIYVTHTWGEVSGRADHVVVLSEGRVAFSGSATEWGQTGVRPGSDGGQTPSSSRSPSRLS
jgi:molybdate transport system ATP-binding protein